MKTRTLLVSVALGTTLVLGACGNSDTSSSGDKMDTKTEMSDKQDKMMKANEKVMLQGSFAGVGKHKVSGMATIKDNKLMLTNFVTDEGPDLHVYLVKGDDVKNGVEVSAIDLKDKTQTFDVSDKDLTEYDNVVIYCEKAHETFGQAPVSEGMDDTAMPMMTGTFAGVGTHKVSGTATVEGSTLKLANFKTDEGPDLHVYLTKDGDINTGMEIDAIDLKDAEQSFDLKNLDTSAYNSVVIYCQKAHEAFGKAMLEG
ncbi:DM13 domain-containing protein [Listeria booriae]|uniref:DM13 domain-containing protein n=1 Tax=Listeria booriae TaxID=1552123 RepID=UPI001626A3FB|nr:DM13 domain-containing protein [Listeria booriae]MBC1210223.1 DM13 domain-containing protein [Listeria booriae]